MRSASDKSCGENQSTHFMLNNVFLKSFRLWDNMEKYCIAGQATHREQYGAYTLHAGWLRLQTHAYDFFTETLVAQTHLSLTLCMYIACFVHIF